MKITVNRYSISKRVYFNKFIFSEVLLDIDTPQDTKSSILFHRFIYFHLDLLS